MAPARTSVGYSQPKPHSAALRCSPPVPSSSSYTAISGTEVRHGGPNPCRLQQKNTTVRARRLGSHSVGAGVCPAVCSTASPVKARAKLFDLSVVTFDFAGSSFFRRWKQFVLLVVAFASQVPAFCLPVVAYDSTGSSIFIRHGAAVTKVVESKIGCIKNRRRFQQKILLVTANPSPVEANSTIDWGKKSERLCLTRHSPRAPAPPFAATPSRAFRRVKTMDSPMLAPRSMGCSSSLNPTLPSSDMWSGINNGGGHMGLLV